MQCESFLKHQRQMQSRCGQDNAQTLFGLEQIPTVPQIRNILDQLAALVADPSQEAWHWKNVKRKTDKDDALKLAKLAALKQINPVYVPAPEARQYRHLVKYRKVVVGRINRVQNTIRALFDHKE